MADKRAMVVIDLDASIDELTACCREWSSKPNSSVVAIGLAPAFDIPKVGHKIRSLMSEGEGLMLEELRRSVAQFCQQLDAPNEHHLMSGATSQDILKAAILNDADFIMTLDNMENGRIGKVAKALIRKSPVPVWVVSGKSNHPPRAVAVAIDNVEAASSSTEASLIALNLIRHALDLAERFGLKEVAIIHAWSVAGMSYLQRPSARVSNEDLRHYMAQCELAASTWFKSFVAMAREHFSAHDVELVERLVMGPAHTAIAQGVEDVGADVLVIGSANRSGLMGLLVGNTAEAVLDEVKSSLFVVKPEGLGAIISEELRNPADKVA
ncbi:MAG: universal stress protein [Pseudomonadota bacterium]